MIKTNESGGRLHTVFEWIKEIYDPKEDSLWQPSANGFIKDASSEMYDGCGTVVETWVYENVWPQAADFGSLDMANNEVVTCDLTLRYARAYIES